MASFNIGFVIFPNITQLDFTGPFEVLSRIATPPALDRTSEFADAKVLILAKTLAPVVSDRGLQLLPNCTFADAPPLDLICIPGGGGVIGAIADPETLEFVRRQGQQARYVTSVCMGSFVLGAAGLLNGRKVTTHWAYADLLPMVGASHEKARVVHDGNVITAAGVSAGIDFAFSVVAELAGRQVAEAIQLAIEYDPAPPFASGHPDKAPDAATRLMVERNKGARTGLIAGLEALPVRG